MDENNLNFIPTPAENEPVTHTEQPPVETPTGVTENIGTAPLSSEPVPAAPVNAPVPQMPENVCKNCRTPLAPGQTFCPVCGAQNIPEQKQFCAACGGELQPGVDFCPRCGNRSGIQIPSAPNPAIAQYNNQIGQQQTKKKVKPAILIGIIAAVVVVVIVAVAIISNIVKQRAIEQYKSDAKAFYSAVLESGSTMEDIGNEIDDAWYSYIYDYRYNGYYYYSIESAVSAAQSYMSSEIATVKSDDSRIQSLYNKLANAPDDSLRYIEDAVYDVYNAYENMYDCVIDPSGNYRTWSSEFSDCDGELADALDTLNSAIY